MTFGVDIKVLGDKALQRKLRKLPRGAQRKAVAPALRDSAKRVKGYLLDNLAGGKVLVRTGRTLEAYAGAKVRADSTRDKVRIGIVPPTREELGISAEDPNYYPFAIEYGHRLAIPYPFMRPAVDEHKQREFRLIARDIGRNVERIARTGK